MSEKEVDPFARPPRAFSADRLEDRACRAALRAVGVPTGRVALASGLEVTGRFTFELLVEYADFPMAARVTEAPVEDLLHLLTGFERTKLYKGWHAVWARHPGPGPRVLVASGPAVGIVVVYESPAPPPRPHVVLMGGSIGPLYMEPLPQWCRALQCVEGEV